VGEEGQDKLDAARVEVGGAGGLGSPVLQYVAAAGIGTLGTIDDDAVDIIVRRATGSLRDALSLVDLLATAAASTKSGRIDADLTRRMLGLSADGWELDLATGLAARAGTAGLTVVARAADAGHDMRAFARRVGELLRLLMLVRAGADPVEADDRVRELASRFELAELLRINERFSELDFKVRTAGFAQLPIELAVVGALVEQPAIVQVAPQPEPARATRPTPNRPAPAPQSSWTTPPRDEAPRKPARDAQAPRDAAPERPASPPRQTPTGEASDSFNRIRDSWEQIRAEIKAMNGKVEALLRESDPDHITDETLHIMAPYPFHTKMLNEPAAREVIETAIVRVTGMLLKVNVFLRPDRELAETPSPRPTPAPPAPAEPTPVDATPDAVDLPAENGLAESADTYRIDRAKTVFDATEIDPDELTNLR
ncbi:MAG TPA: ThiF family adenylyltransferase, partial [Thermomicrobiales bacterium]|nr:ThiF family adenylyltransferase [Thermomicrobiales bacterium]